MKILVIEDESSLANFMEKGLQQAGYSVFVSNDGARGLEIAATENFDLILLDLMLPGTNGFDILTNLRAFQVKTPVIVISALSNTEHVVKGLGLGAIDYIRKPFEWEELLARIRVVQNRFAGTESSVLRYDELTIDLLERKVTRDGKDIKLTVKEFVLLEYLARNANRVVSKNQIMEQVWDMNFDPGSNIVEVHMYQLRKKIDKNFAVPLIETVIGLGYTLRASKKN